MHLNRKTVEQIEVDWVGDPATIIEPDTGEILKVYIFVGVMTYSCTVYKESENFCRTQISLYGKMVS